MTPSQRLQNIASSLRQAVDPKDYTTEAETKRIATALVKAYETYRETVESLLKDSNKNWRKLDKEMESKRPEMDSDDEEADWWYEVMRTAREGEELHRLLESHLSDIGSVDSNLERFTRG